MNTHRVKSPSGISDHLVKAVADQVYADEKQKLKDGEKVSQHVCPHAQGEPPSEWYNCRSDPRAEFFEEEKKDGLLVVVLPGP